MRQRRALCTAIMLAAFVLPALSGCAASGPPGAAAAQAGVLGEFLEQVKREDDQSETEEHIALREVRQESYEHAQEEEIEWH